MEGLLNGFGRFRSNCGGSDWPSGGQGKTLFPRTCPNYLRLRPSPTAETAKKGMAKRELIAVPNNNQCLCSHCSKRTLPGMPSPHLMLGKHSWPPNRFGRVCYALFGCATLAGCLSPLLPAVVIRRRPKSNLIFRWRSMSTRGLGWEGTDQIDLI